MAPIVFLYAMLAETHALPQRIDRLFYAAAQSIIIVVALSTLITTVFAPAASHWRLIPAGDTSQRTKAVRGRNPRTALFVGSPGVNPCDWQTFFVTLRPNRVVLR